MPPKRSVFDWILEAITIAVLLLMLAFVILHWGQLPDQIPRHFTAAGDPDRWGSKSGVWVLPIIAATMYVALTVVAGFPQRFNVPFQIDRSNPEVLSLMRRTMMAVRLEMLVAFAYISWTAIETALGNTSGLGRGFLPLAITGALAPVIYYLAKLRRYRL